LDDALHGSDAIATSLVLAKAIETTGLIWCCVEWRPRAPDRRHPAMLAERLNIPQVSFANSLSRAAR